MGLLIYLVRQDVEISNTEATVPTSVSQTALDESPPAPFLLARATMPPVRRNGEPCLVRRLSIRGSDGRLLTRSRIRADLIQAGRLLGKLDRSSLSPEDRAALNNAQDTVAEIIAAAQD
jgi:hypothetical protein